MTVLIGLLLGISVVIDPHAGSILFSAVALFVGLYAQAQINQAKLGTLCVKDLSVNLSPCMKLEFIQSRRALQVASSVLFSIGICWIIFVWSV